MDSNREMERLPRGRHGLSAEFVARNQRDRLITGLIQALHDVGYENTTVSIIGQRAAVSKSDFYKHFESKDDCFVAAYDAAVERIRESLVGACEGIPEEDWAGRIGAALRTLLERFDAEPELASIVLVEGLRAGRGVYDRYQLAVESFVNLMREGAPVGVDGAAVPPTTDEAVVGGITSMVGRRLLAGQERDLSELFPEILEFVLAAYLGADEARRIVSAG
jgi:AcrR family transcriptional regulator